MLLFTFFLLGYSAHNWNVSLSTDDHLAMQEAPTLHAHGHGISHLHVHCLWRHT